MREMEKEVWIDEALLRYQRLTQSVVAIIKALLMAKGIAYLTVEGRTKSREGVQEKIERKGYTDPKVQMTDITGVRVILYFESDVQKVSGLIESCFTVDAINSLDKGSLLSVDKIGYRSVHYVCDIGTERSNLPEFEGMAGLKFEVQLRTVLQHAWAEIAHDRNYKFSGKLPKNIERELYLFAGMLEVADKGFDKLSKEIDIYGEEVRSAVVSESRLIPVDSVSLTNYVVSWGEKNNCPLSPLGDKDNYADLVGELDAFGINTLGELEEIIPKDFAERVKYYGERLTVYSCVRSWMLIHDWKRFNSSVNFNWVISIDAETLESYIPKDELDDFKSAFGPKKK